MKAPSNGFPETNLETKLIYLVTKDRHLSDFLSHQLLHYGYFVQEVSNYSKLLNTKASHQSIATLIDIDSIGDPDDHAKPIVIESWETDEVRFFISNHDAQSIRLEAIRKGGDAYFTKPINIVALVDKLDSLEPNTDPSQKYRVMIIENELTVAKYYQMLLNMSGMDSQIITHPGEVLSEVRNYHPDLILIDTGMPGTNGVELAKIIRQIDEFISIPIIFLSNEDDFSKRVEALELGGDDFLIKPIKASHLLAVVRGRLERLKTLRSYMVRDSLTNLLNHTSFRNLLSIEVERANRQKTPLSLAMLDLDHFKQVNDTYGHAAGDSVLKSLARLLQQRIRKSDLIGRYGGEEFVALFMNCNAYDAFRIMDEIRESFSEIEFYPNEDAALSVTFSCGISTFPEAPTAKMLSDLADKALYVAKDAGRNQIKLAEN